MTDDQKMVADYYGEAEERLQLTEECAELITALNHNRRKEASGEKDYASRHDIMEEMADVLVGIGNVAYLMGFSQDNIRSLMAAKIERQKKRIGRG